MRSFLTRKWVLFPAIFYTLTGCALWMAPLFNILHAESSAVIAGVSFFIAGLAALAQFHSGATFRHTLLVQLGLLLIPWLLLTLTLFWQPNCSYGQGLLFYLLFPIPTVFLSVAFAFFLHAASIKWKKTAVCLFGLVMGLGGVIYDLGFHAQFFTYNHLFGGVLGPIYDEELTIRAGLIFFRLRTLLLGILFIWLGQYAAGDKHLRFKLVGVGGLLLLSYVFAAQLRINTPAWFIKKHLTGHLATPHFDIYYDSASVDSAAVALLGHEHEYRYHYVQQQLGIDVSRRIQSFIYPDDELKHWLTGSRNTSVTPVWLAEPQMHMLTDVFNEVFPHELGHVFSREFGLPIIKASLSVGLVEGLAVALEPPDGRPTPHEQVLTAVTLATPPGESLDPGSTIGLASRLSPLGFWTGRGAVSYTTMGSFVGFLADTYGYERVIAVYASSNFEEAFGKPINTLVAEWGTYLAATPQVDRAAQLYAVRRFSVPSLFEKACPHFLPDHERYLRESADALARSDTMEALQLIERSLEIEPAYESALDAWSAVQIARGEAQPVIDRLLHTLQDTSSIRLRSAGLWVRLGDALALEGAPENATAAFDSARVQLPLYAHQQHGFIALRKALAGLSEVQLINRAPDSAAVKVEKMDALLEREDGIAPEELGAVRVLQGVLLALDEKNASALEYLERVDLGQMAHAPEISRLVRIVRALLYYRVGAYEEALLEAEHIENEFRSIGAFNSAALYADFADKMRYIIEA